MSWGPDTNIIRCLEMLQEFLGKRKTLQQLFSKCFIDSKLQCQQTNEINASIEFRKNFEMIFLTLFYHSTRIFPISIFFHYINLKIVFFLSFLNHVVLPTFHLIALELLLFDEIGYGVWWWIYRMTVRLTHFPIYIR